MTTETFGAESSSQVGSGKGSGAADKAKETASQAAQQTQELADKAAVDLRDVTEQTKAGAKDVTRTAAQEAGHIAADMSNQIRGIVGDAGSQLYDHGSQQTEKMAQSLRQLSDGAQALAEGRTQDAGVAGQYVQQAGAKLASIADRLDADGVDGLVDEVRTFARNRPGAFLLAAGVAGFAAGRLAKGAKAIGNDDTTNTTYNNNINEYSTTAPMQAGTPRTGGMYE